MSDGYGRGKLDQERADSERAYNFFSVLEKAKGPGHPGYSIMHFPREGSYEIRCHKCGLSESLAYGLTLTGHQIVSARLMEIATRHAHKVPVPLTKEQRERELVMMRHRRGAWKL